MGFAAELDTSPDRGQEDEALTVTFDDGHSETMRLHEYGRVYAVPGLYEDVVQRQLECASPSTLTDALVEQVAAAGESLDALRVLDLGAGNGVVAEHLVARGVPAPFVGLDNEPEAKLAADRDRPGLYADYFVGGLEEAPLRELVREHGLNAMVGAGALGLGHIPPSSFDSAWGAFPVGSWMAITAGEDIVDDEGHELAEYVAALRRGEHGTEVLHLERFRHRLRMSGDPIHYYVLVARRTG
jgi:trans-aconitate methyltransferase